MKVPIREKMLLPNEALDRVWVKFFQDLADKADEGAEESVEALMPTDSSMVTALRQRLDALEMQVALIIGPDPTHENRIRVLEDLLEEGMEQLDTIISRLDSIEDMGDTIGNVLVELKVISNLLNEGMNVKEDLDILRIDEVE